MTRPKKQETPRGRVSPTAPESKSLSAGVWDFLENEVPGFDEAMETGTAQLKSGKSTPLKEWRRGR